MLRRGVSAVVVLLGTALAACGQSVPLTLMKIDEVDRKGGTIQVKLNQIQHRQVTRQVQENVNGQVVVRNVTEKVPVTVTVTMTLPLANFRPHTGDGKPLDAKQLRERLRPGVVVVVGGEELLQPQFRAVFRPEALLLVEKKGPAPMPGR
jgi:hypothetical protein